MDDTGRSAKIRVGGSGDGSWVVLPRAWWLICHIDARPDVSILQVREDRANLVISREIIILESYVHSAEISVSWCVFLQYEFEGFLWTTFIKYCFAVSNELLVDVSSEDVLHQGFNQVHCSCSLLWRDEIRGGGRQVLTRVSNGSYGLNRPLPVATEFLSTNTASK